MHDAHDLGRRSERAAERYLIRRGWKILGRNVSLAGGELDLVAARRGVLAFCEVKARHDGREAVTALRNTQADRTDRAAGAYLAKRPEFQGHRDRLDLITVEPRCLWLRVRHYPGTGGRSPGDASGS